MDTTALVLLGLIALGSLLQSVVLVALAVGGLRLARRVDEVGARLDREVRPALEDLSRAARNVGEVVELTTAQARRLDALVDDTTGKLRDAGGRLSGVIVPVVGQLAAALAAIRGLRGVLRALGRLRRLF